MYKKIAFVVGADGLIKIAGFFLLPVYLFLMPKADFGEFSFLTSALGILPPILALGIYVPQIKESSSSDDLGHKKTVFTSSFLLVLIFTAIFSLIAILSENLLLIFKDIFSLTSDEKYKFLIFLIICVLSTLNLVLYSHAMHFSSKNILIKYNTLRFILVNTISLILLYFGFSAFDSSLNRLIGLTAGELIFCFLSFIWIGKNYWEWRIDLNYLFRALKLGLPVIPGSIALIFSTLSDRYFLGKYYGLDYVAELNLALQFLLPIQLVMTGAQTLWAPHVYSIKNNLDARLQSFRFSISLFFIFLSFIPFLLLVFYCGLLFGMVPKTYSNIMYLIPILSFGSIGIILLQIPFNLFIKNDRTILIAYISIFISLLNIIGNMIFVPYYSYYGSAIVSAVLNISVLGVVWAYIFKKNNMGNGF